MQSWHDKNIGRGRRLRNASSVLLRALVTLCAVLSQGGCQVNVGGRQRPLVSRKPVDISMEITADRQVDRNRIAGQSGKSTGTDFKELLRLRTSGDVYHRNLLTYTIGLGLGLRQQQFTSDGASDSADGSLEEYDVTAGILQSKPYPIDLYASRTDQTEGRRFSGSVRTQTERSGAMMGFWLFDEWPMRFQYSNDETDQTSLGSAVQDSFTRRDERFRYSVSHSLSATSKMHFDFETTNTANRRSGSSTNLKVDRYDFSHDLIFGKDDQHRLNSDVYLFDYSGLSDQKRLRVQELMRLRHADNLWTDYTLQFTRSRQREATNKETVGAAGFRHELYDSLVTAGNVFATRSDIADGVDLTEHGGRITFDYRKNNPLGTLFGSYSASLARFEQTGSGGVGRVDDEPHTYDTNGTTRVELGRRNVDPSTIVVSDQSSIPYSPLTDYRIEENSGITSVVIITGGKIFNDAVTNGGAVVFLTSYDFFVEPEQRNDVRTQFVSVRQRFTNGAALYYRHRRRDEKPKSDLTEITPDEFRVNTFGAEYSNNGLHLKAEYMQEDATQISSTSKWLQASYNWAIDMDTRANIYVSNLSNDFGGAEPHEVRIFSVGGELSSRLADAYRLVGGVNYRRERDSSFGNTSGFQYDIGLRYGYRQLTISTGVEFDMLSQNRDDRESTFFYFRLKRIF